MESIIIALVTGALTGGIAWGAMRADMRHLRESVQALHARVDALTIALAHDGLIVQDAVNHLSRARERA